VVDNAAARPRGSSHAGRNLLIGCLALIVIVVVLGGVAAFYIFTTVSHGISQFAGSFQDSTYTIRVVGTPGTSFTGSYAIVPMPTVPDSTGGSTDGGQPDVDVSSLLAGAVTESVSGTVPAEYTGRGVFVAVHLEKDAAEGTLHVQILKGDQVVNDTETQRPYGKVEAARGPGLLSLPTGPIRPDSFPIP
jgi:hypothetical protein